MPEPEMTAQYHDPLGRVALAWLPAGDYELAVSLWPDLAKSDLVAGSGRPLPHRQYCRAMQQRQLDCVALGFRTNQALRLAQDVVIDVNVGSHTHHVAQAVV
jgi:hypothetical protein